MKNWFSEHKKSILLSVIGTLLPMGIGCILWNRLPDSMQIHWNAAAAADGMGSKAIAVFLLPGILAALNLLCMAVTAADPKQKGQNSKALGMIFWIMPLISMVACCTVYAAALGKTVDIMLLIPLLLGALCLVMGNYMPKVKQNSTLGIKIFWTLRNEENWNKTHRFTGKLWVICGFVMFLSVLLPLKWMLGVLVGTIFVMTVPTVLYSYWIYRGHKAQGISYDAPAQSKGQKRVKALMIVLPVIILAGAVVLMLTGNIHYTYGADALEIEATYSRGLRISYEEMDEVVLREDFDIGARTFGFSSARLNTGSFWNEELQDYTIYAYPACDVMVLIRSGDHYLAVNAQTPEETRALYETLLEKAGK